MRTLDTHTMGLADHQSNQKHPVFFWDTFYAQKKVSNLCGSSCYCFVLFFFLFRWVPYLKNNVKPLLNGSQQLPQEP